MEQSQPTSAPYSPPTSPMPMMSPPAASGIGAGKIIAGLAVLALVAVGAYYLGKAGEEELAVTPSPSPSVVALPTTTTAPTASPTPTSDPTAGWKTYTNTQYGFEFKYPNNWRPGSKASTAAWVELGSLKNLDYPSPCPKDYYSFSVSGPTLIPSQYKTFEVFANEDYDPQGGHLGAPPSGGKTKISIDGHVAYRYGRQDGEFICGGPLVRVQYDAQNYLTLSGAWADTNSTLIFDQILSTFRFSK